MSETQPLSQDVTSTEQQDVSKLFGTALSLQNEKKGDESQQVYLKILDIGQNQNTEAVHPSQVSAVSHNLSLTYFEKKEFGLAYIYNQKALNLDSANKPAEELAPLILKSFEPPAISHTITIEEQIQNLGVKNIPLEAFYMALIILFFWVLNHFRNWYLSHKKYELGQTLNRPSPWKLTLLIFFFCIFGSLTFFKYLQDDKTLAILKATKAIVAVEAGENQAQITEISQGLTLEVLQTKKVQDKVYAQVKYSGAFTGWIPQSDLELLNRTNWTQQ